MNFYFVKKEQPFIKVIIIEIVHSVKNFSNVSSPAYLIVPPFATPLLSSFKTDNQGRPSSQCHCAMALVFFCPAPKVRAYFGRHIIKSLDSPKWYWLILASMGALADSIASMLEVIPSPSFCTVSCHSLIAHPWTSTLLYVILLCCTSY